MDVYEVDKTQRPRIVMFLVNVSPENSNSRHIQDRPSCQTSLAHWPQGECHPVRQQLQNEKRRGQQILCPLLPMAQKMTCFHDKRSSSTCMCTRYLKARLVSRLRAARVQLQPFVEGETAVSIASDRLRTMEFVGRASSWRSPQRTSSTSLMT